MINWEDATHLNTISRFLARSNSSMIIWKGQIRELHMQALLPRGLLWREYATRASKRASEAPSGFDVILDCLTPSHRITKFKAYISLHQYYYTFKITSYGEIEMDYSSQGIINGYRIFHHVQNSLTCTKYTSPTDNYHKNLTDNQCSFKKSTSPRKEAAKQNATPAEPLATHPYSTRGR